MPISRSIPSRRTVLKASAAFAAGTVMAPRVRAAERSDVIVIGGGFAGLKTAIMLADEGMSVTVLEANSRVGGRAYTADHIYGTPELGASQIGPYYARVRDMADRLGVELAPGANINAPFTMAIGDTLIRKEDWESHPLNKTVGDERTTLPSAMQGFYIKKHNPFQGFDDWLEPEAAKFDIPLAQWLLDHGISEEGMRLVNAGLIAPDAWNVSLLTILQEATRASLMSGAGDTKGKDRFELAALTSSHVVGGTSRLPEAMARSLGDSVLLNKIVASIHMSDTGVDVGCLDGTRYQSDFVVSAIPFGPLRRVSITPALGGEQAAAVRHMPYANNTQLADVSY